jgi:uric acid-xanthine permease
MIGASLVGSSGFPNWGGGSNNCQTRPPDGIFQLCPTIFAPRPLPCACSLTDIVRGTDLSFRWGSPEFIGLGFLSFITIIITEMFGSPFLKNISIIMGLAVGCIVAGAAGYIDSSSIKQAPAITFLWCVTLPLGDETRLISDKGPSFQNRSLSSCYSAYVGCVQSVFS